MLLAELVPQAETGSGDGPHIHQLHVELACTKYSQDIASLFPLMEKRCLFPDIGTGRIICISIYVFAIFMFIFHV
jgi:hypothetical protein